MECCIGGKVYNELRRDWTMAHDMPPHWYRWTFPVCSSSWCRHLPLARPISGIEACQRTVKTKIQLEPEARCLPERKHFQPNISSQNCSAVDYSNRAAVVISLHRGLLSRSLGVRLIPKFKSDLSNPTTNPALQPNSSNYNLRLEIDLDPILRSVTTPCRGPCIKEG